MTIEWRTYEISQQDKLQRIAMVSVPLPTHTSCVKFSPTQELLLLCCIDGSVMVYDQARATTTNVKAAFVSFIKYVYIFLVVHMKLKQVQLRS